jgi:hypothetical protein
MPVLSRFYGLIISMYYLDKKQHNLPHIHVRYGDDEAVYSIPEGELLEGKLPKKRERLILAWIEMRKEDLMTNWALASKGETIFPIEPLR